VWILLNGHNTNPEETNCEEHFESPSVACMLPRKKCPAEVQYNDVPNPKTR
jgi:hypothetical protein